jgi:hypothetical protein
MFKKVLTSRELKLTFFLSVLLGALVLLVLGRYVKSSISKRLLSRQQIITRAEAVNIESFFQTIGKSVSVVAQSDAVQKGNSQAEANLDAFVWEWQDTNLVGGVLLTDSSGVVKYNSNPAGFTDIGASLSDRDYIVWASQQKQPGSYFVGRSVISRVGITKGEVVVPIVSPIFKNGRFVGTVTAAVKLKPLKERFLGLMELSDTTEVYLINEENVLLYSKSSPNLVGLGAENLDDVFANFRYASNEGALQIDKYLVAFSPVDLGARKWLLVIAIPVQTVTDMATPTSIKQTAVLLLIFYSVVFLGIVMARSKRVFRKKVN